MTQLRRVFSVFALLAVLALPSFAQQAQQTKTIKPRLAVGDAVFCLNLFNTVEIRGEEVDNFLAIRNLFTQVVTKAQADKKTAADQVVVEMNVPMAQNFVTLMQRARLAGADADKFREIISGVVSAAQAEMGQNK